MRLRVLTGFPKARERAAERKRSRSDADTGRKTGLGFGLCLFFRRENRLRFSRRAGPSCWLSFCGSQSRRACGGASSMPGPDARAERNERSEFAGLPRRRRPARAVLRTAGGSSQRKLSLKRHSTCPVYSERHRN